MYNKLASFILLAAVLGLGACGQPSEQTTPNGQTGSIQTDKNRKIQVALLLDTSSSMDGLIEQAKARLWNVVNTLTTLRYNGKMPSIEIALYEYGNDGLSAEANYIRQVSTLTTDLDLISEQLFSLRTNGGEEYCGAVIKDATDQLKWGEGESDMKLIYIAGNEEFDQGGTHFEEAISSARRKDIYINTIFCGNPEEGIRTFWKNGATAGLGNYFTIDQNEAIVYVATPYDDKISRCNERLNGTYIGYGAQGYTKKNNQLRQDAHANAVSYSVSTDRAISKSKPVYNNTTWDLVDKVKEDKNALKNMQKSELPAELQSKSEKEVEAYVAKKTKEREQIQREIGQLAKQRQAYIDQQAKKRGQKDLGDAITSSILKLARKKGYTIAK